MLFVVVFGALVFCGGVAAWPAAWSRDYQYGIVPPSTQMGLRDVVGDGDDIAGVDVVDEDGCKYSKYDVFVCIDRYADLDHDRRLTESELLAVKEWLRWYEVGAWWLVGGSSGVLSECGAFESADSSTGMPQYCTRESLFERAECLADCRKRTAAIERYCVRRAQEEQEDIYMLMDAARQMNDQTYTPPLKAQLLVHHRRAHPEYGAWLAQPSTTSSRVTLYASEQ
jgi:hypothetical protein